MTPPWRPQPRYADVVSPSDGAVVKASRYPPGRSRHGKDMNRRPGGDASLNAPIRNDGEAGEWQDWLAEDTASQETTLAEGEESANRHKVLVGALTVLKERGATSLRLGGWLMIPSRWKNFARARDN